VPTSDPLVQELKAIVHDVLGSVASRSLLNSMDATIEEGASTGAGLVPACTKVESMANLFLGADKAQTVSRRLRESLRRAGIQTA
jgi:hypothetical protein